MWFSCRLTACKMCSPRWLHPSGDRVPLIPLWLHYCLPWMLHVEIFCVWFLKNHVHFTEMPSHVLLYPIDHTRRKRRGRRRRKMRRKSRRRRSRRRRRRSALHACPKYCDLRKKYRLTVVTLYHKCERIFKQRSLSRRTKINGVVKNK